MPAAHRGHTLDPSAGDAESDVVLVRLDQFADRSMSPTQLARWRRRRTSLVDATQLELLLAGQVQRHEDQRSIDLREPVRRPLRDEHEVSGGNAA